MASAHLRSLSCSWAVGGRGGSWQVVTFGLWDLGSWYSLKKCTHMRILCIWSGTNIWCLISSPSRCSFKNYFNMLELFLWQFASPVGVDLRRCGWNMKWWLKDENLGSAETLSRIFGLLSKRRCILKRKKWKKLKEFLCLCCLWWDSRQRRIERL